MSLLGQQKQTKNFKNTFKPNLNNKKISNLCLSKEKIKPANQSIYQHNFNITTEFKSLVSHRNI